MGKVFTICMGFLLCCMACGNHQETAMATYYIGTYTNGTSEGIYRVDFNQVSGMAGEVMLAADTENPSFLAYNAGHIYAVNEDVAGAEDAMVTAWKIEENGELIESDRLSAEGAYACYISVNDDFALVANYGGGSVLSIPLEGPGAFDGPSQLIRHEGSGPDSTRQEGPHAHSIVLSPDNTLALSADLGIDKVMVYKVENRGMLMPADPPFIQMAPGAGPRHIAFHPDLNTMYVINELNNSVSVFSFEGNQFQEAQTISTLPEDFAGTSYCADIHVHPSGKFVYGSNRGHDSIVVFAADANGRLSPVQHFSTDVNWPRNFHITENGRYILIANERGDSIVVGEIDQDTGMITDTGKRINVPAPVCILPVE